MKNSELLILLKLRYQILLTWLEHAVVNSKSVSFKEHERGSTATVSELLGNYQRCLSRKFGSMGSWSSESCPLVNARAANKLPVHELHSAF